MALRKTRDARGNYKVTFALPADVEATEVAVCGDFNDWALDAHPLKRRKDGRFSTTLTLPGGRDYRFRYLLDNERWENDWDADDYVRNEFGGDDSLLRLSDSPNGSSPGAAAAGDTAALDRAPEPNEPA